MNIIMHLYDKWCNLPRFFRFLVIGALNALISYIIFVIAIQLLGANHYQVCVFIQWSVSSVTSYFNQKFFVFLTRGNYLAEYIKCCSTWAVGYVLNVVILELLLRYLIKNVYISQVLSIFLVSMLTYVLFKYFAFRQKS